MRAHHTNNGTPRAGRALEREPGKRALRLACLCLYSVATPAFRVPSETPTSPLPRDLCGLRTCTHTAYRVRAQPCSGTNNHSCSMTPAAIITHRRHTRADHTARLPVDLRRDSPLSARPPHAHHARRGRTANAPTASGEHRHGGPIRLRRLRAPSSCCPSQRRVGRCWPRGSPRQQTWQRSRTSGSPTA